MPAIMLPHGYEGLRVRRRTVLWTFRRPFMGRPVPRQFMRNALLDVTTIVPATAYHRRSYAERYSRSIQGAEKTEQCVRMTVPISSVTAMLSVSRPNHGGCLSPYCAWHPPESVATGARAL